MQLHGLLFQISSKGSFICIIPLAFVIPIVENWLAPEVAQWVDHEGSSRRLIVHLAPSRKEYGPSRYGMSRHNAYNYFVKPKCCCCCFVFVLFFFCCCWGFLEVFCFGVVVFSWCVCFTVFVLFGFFLFLCLFVFKCVSTKVEKKKKN